LKKFTYTSSFTGKLEPSRVLCLDAGTLLEFFFIIIIYLLINYKFEIYKLRFNILRIFKYMVF